MESAIRDLLYIGASPARIAEKITHRLKISGGTRRERKALVNFLIQSGHHNKAYQLIGHWMPKRHRVPWNEFLFILQNAGYKPSPEFFQNFFRAMQEVEEVDRVRYVPFWTNKDPRVDKWNTDFLKILDNRQSEEVAKLKQKLSYFRTHRMIYEEEKLLEDLFLRFPEDQTVLREREAFRSKWAHHLIAEKVREKLLQKHPHKLGRISGEEAQFGQNLYQFMLEEVSKAPHMAYDFSIGLYVLEFFDKAAELVAHAPPTLATDWFFVESLLKSGRYIDCLNGLSAIERKYADDPETIFSATYLRAQTLHALGQKSLGIQLLKSIVNVRPAYRSAHALLTEWGLGQ